MIRPAEPPVSDLLGAESQSAASQAWPSTGKHLASAGRGGSEQRQRRSAILLRSRPCRCSPAAGVSTGPTPGARGTFGSVLPNKEGRAGGGATSRNGLSALIQQAVSTIRRGWWSCLSSGTKKGASGPVTFLLASPRLPPSAMKDPCKKNRVPSSVDFASVSLPAVSRLRSSALSRAPWLLRAAGVSFWLTGAVGSSTVKP